MGVEWRGLDESGVKSIVNWSGHEERRGVERS